MQSRLNNLWNTNAIDYPGVEATPLHFRVHNCRVMKIKGALTLPDNDKVVCWEYYSGSLLVFSLESNKLSFNIPLHSLPPLAVSHLSHHVILCSNANKTLSLVDVSAGVRISKVSLPHNVTCIARLDNQNFVIVCGRNLDTMCVAFPVQTERKPFFQKIKSTALQENVVLAKSYEHHVAILTLSSLIMWDASRSEAIVSCSADGHVDELVVSERFVVYASYKSRYVAVRHTTDLQLVRHYELQATFSNFSILGSILMTSFYRRLSRTKLSRNHEILFSSLDTGDIVYKMILPQSNSSASRISSPCFFLPDGRVVSAFRSKSWLLCITLPDIVMQYRNRVAVAADQAAAERRDTKPLQTAFVSCLNGHTTPKDMCLNLVSHKLCKESVTEWFCGHRILMLAVYAGQIEPSPDFDDRYGFWFETIYLAAKDIPIYSETDFNVVRKALREAVLSRVIRSEEPIIAAIHISRDMRNSKNEISALGQELLSRIFQIERSSNHFSTALQNYVAFQSKANLFSAAFNMIPFIGGSIASAISAGSRIFEGCAVTNNTELAIDIGTDVALGFKSFEEKVLLAAAEGLKTKNVQSMSDDLKSVLVLSLQESGVKREQLRALFLGEGVKDTEVPIPPEWGSSPQKLHGSGTKDDDGQGNVCANRIPALGHGNQKEGKSSEQTSTPSIAQCSKHEDNTDKESAVIDEHSVDTIELKHLEKVGLDAQSIEKFGEKVMAALLAAYIIGFNERRREKYNQLRGHFYNIFLEQDIDGSVFSNREYFPVDQIVKVILKGLENLDTSLITFGIEGKIRLYLFSIN